MKGRGQVGGDLVIGQLLLRHAAPPCSTIKCAAVISMPLWSLSHPAHARAPCGRCLHCEHRAAALDVGRNRLRRSCAGQCGIWSCRWHDAVALVLRNRPSQPLWRSALFVGCRGDGRHCARREASECTQVPCCTAGKAVWAILPQCLCCVVQMRTITAIAGAPTRCMFTEECGLHVDSVRVAGECAEHCGTGGRPDRLGNVAGGQCSRDV